MDRDPRTPPPTRRGTVHTEREALWLEIIHLRSSGEPIESLGRSIEESLAANRHGVEAVTLYRRHGLGTDLAVHIRHSGAAGQRVPSRLALRLASELRAYGLVEHTHWEELR